MAAQKPCSDLPTLPASHRVRSLRSLGTSRVWPLRPYPPRMFPFYKWEFLKLHGLGDPAAPPGLPVSPLAGRPAAPAARGSG